MHDGTGMSRNYNQCFHTTFSAIGDGSTIDMGKYTCTVDYNRDGQVDMTFHAGESYPDGEACNYCTCSGENMAACTEMACLPSQG